MAKSFKRKLDNAIKTLAVAVLVAAGVLCFIATDNGLFQISKRLNSNETDYVRVIDVGQGDSILIHSNGYSALIDTGPAENSKQLTASLHNAGIEVIDVLIFTHLHIDHTGGVSDVLREFEVKNLILPELSTFSEGIGSAQLAINSLTKSGGQIYKAVEDMHFELGDAQVLVLGAYADIVDDNNRSLIIKAKLEGKSFLFMGDAEMKTEKRLLEDKKDLKSDVLKVGHHGSNSSTIGDFLEAVEPQFAAISVGKNNQYHHPHLATIKQLKKRGISVYRTDHSGDITFYTENKKIRVETEK